MLTQWEKELEMLEDWLNNPEPEEGLPRDSHAKIGGEYQPEEQLEEAGVVPAENWQKLICQRR
jgi:hypothetical protein